MTEGAYDITAITQGLVELVSAWGLKVFAAIVLLVVGRIIAVGCGVWSVRRSGGPNSIRLSFHSFPEWHIGC